MILKALSCILILLFLVAALRFQAAAHPWQELGREALRNVVRYILIGTGTCLGWIACAFLFFFCRVSARLPSVELTHKGE